ACYQQDGLLRLHYDSADQLTRAVVALPVEVTLPESASASERLLAARARQVRMLMEENARLAGRVAALERITATATPAATGAVAVEDMAALVPPRDLELSVGGEFRAVGDEFFAYFVDLGRLRPTDRVLDVGCGIGRMAVPLTRYLTAAGRYDGFDITARSIAW